jgi:hypothetical protein
MNIYFIIDLCNMNKIELLECFTTFTREDFKNLDKIRTDIFAPTQEEIEAEEARKEEEKINIITQKLAKYNIVPPVPFTREFMIWFLDKIDAKEFIWADYNKFIDDNIVLYWTMEKAFHALVYERLK